MAYAKARCQSRDFPTLASARKQLKHLSPFTLSTNTDRRIVIRPPILKMCRVPVLDCATLSSPLHSGAFQSPALHA